jgi:hypothetical protein
VARFTLTTGGTPHEWPSFFLGQALRQDPGPLYYPVTLAFRLGPVTLAGLLMLLVVLRGRSARTAAVLWLIAYVALIIGLMTLGSKKLDRYMLPAIVGLDLVAGAGLWAAVSMLRWRRLSVLVLAAALLIQVGLLRQAHPYPLAFYNPLLGGAAGAQRVMLVGWGEGLDQVAEYLNAQPGAEDLVVSTFYDDVLRPLFRGTTVGLTRSGNLFEAVPLDFFIVYVNMAQRQIIPPEVAPDLVGASPEFTVSINGAEYAWVYRLSPPRPKAGDPTREGG